MNIVESIERYLAGSSVSKGVRTRLVRARDEIVKLRRGKQEQWQELTDEQIDSACLNYRHDFGLLSVTEQDELRFQAKEWAEALAKARGNT
jgi:hypothetical protein